MKTKIISLIIALTGLNINVANADSHSVNGNVGVKVTSDYHRRGQVVSTEAIQAQVGVNSQVSNVDLFANFFTNQSTENERDSNEIVAGVGSTFLDSLVSVYGGVYNTDFSDADSDLEYFVKAGLNVALTPTFSFYRSLDTELNTFEGQLSQSFDLKAFVVEISGVLGNTELTQNTDSTYSAAKLEVSKEINGVNLYADVAVSDNNSRDYETIYGAGIQIKF